MTSAWLAGVSRAAISLTWVAVAQGRSGRWGVEPWSLRQGVERDAAFFDCFAHDHGEQGEDAGDGGVGAGAAEVFDPAFDAPPGDVAEAGQDVDV